MRADIDGRATLYLGDCLEVMPALDGVDHVITDPPYSKRTHAGHAASINGHLGPRLDGANRADLGYDCLDRSDVSRIANHFCALSAGWIVWMCDHHLAPHIQHDLEAAGRYVFPPLPYYAPGSRVRLSGDGPSSWTIWIMVARTAAQNNWGTLPGGYVAEPGWRERNHMGGKPVALMAAIVRDYSHPGDIILDPFMGSGTTGVAALRAGRRFIGIEREPRYFELARERIEAAAAQGDMFAPVAARPEQDTLI